MDVYRPSGKFEFRVLPWFAFMAGLGALGAWLYQGLTRWIPIIQLNLITVAGFALVVGGMMMFAVNMGHCRSRLVALLLSLPASFAILAASYYWAYRHMASVIAKERPDLASEFSFPVWAAVRLESGWTVGHGGSGLDVSGWWVAGLWAIELFAVIGFGVVLAWRQAKEPFCEDCAQWTASKTLRLPGLSRAAADGPIAAGDLAALIALQPGGEDFSSLALTVESCGKCKQRGWLNVEEATVIQKRGKAHTKTNKLLANATLDPDQLARFLARTEQPAPPPPA